MTHKSLDVLENECGFDVLERRNGRQARLDASKEDRHHIQASCPSSELFIQLGSRSSCRSQDQELYILLRYREGFSVPALRVKRKMIAMKKQEACLMR